MVATDDPQIELKAAPSVGERLKKAREAQKLTIADVASELRLVRGNVENLENGNWKDLHGRAYALGYFTSYVKFLNMPQDEMLAAFNIEYQNNVGEPTLLKPIPNLDAKESKKGLFIFFIVLLALITWFGYQQWPRFQSEETLVSQPSDSDDSGQERPEQDSQPIINEQAQSAEEHLQSPDLAYESMVVESPVATETIALVEQEYLALSSHTSEALPAITQQPPASSNTDFSVDLAFTDDCWVEVTDAKAKVLLSQIMKKDSKTTLVGEPPFTILLGRASATTVTVNDKVFDTEPYTRRNVARFKLGADS